MSAPVAGCRAGRSGAAGLRGLAQRRVAVLKALAGAALLLTGAAPAMDLSLIGGARYSVPVASLRAVRFRTTVHQQYDFSCGSAALATLLSQHYGWPISEQRAFEQMYLRGDRSKIRREGFSLLDIKRFLEANGFRADGFQLPLKTLAEAGVPAIVLVSDKGYKHFVVIKGLQHGRVLLGDPAGGTRAVPQAAFEAMWDSKLLFVIHDWRGPVRFNAATDWRAAPLAPLQNGVNRDGLDTVTMPKHGQGDF
jgi:predicted double-glycine peptidase